MKTILIVVLASCWLPIVNAEFVFNETTKEVTYPEGITAGSSIYQTTVINIPASETVTYSLTESDATAETTLFEVTDAGLVKLKTDQTLDFETKSSHVLTLTCSSDTPTASARTGVPSLTLTVTVDNVAPTFDKLTYTTSIEDGSTAGAVLGTYQARDPGNTAVTYSIGADGNTNDDFFINATGVVLVNTNKSLNKTATPSYILVLYATDSIESTAKTGSTTVTVTVGVDNGTSARCVSLLALMACIFAYLTK